MPKFEVSTFFIIGYTESKEQGHDLIGAMPLEFHKKGHFTIANYKNVQGFYAVKWECHMLKGKQPLIDLPFKVMPVS